MRPLCTENGVEHNQSYIRAQDWPDVRDQHLSSIAVLGVCTCRNYVLYIMSFLLILRSIKTYLVQ